METNEVLGTPTYLLYLGRKGAGVNFAQELSKQVNFDRLFLSSSLRREFAENNVCTFVPAPKNILSYFFFLTFPSKGMRKITQFLNVAGMCNLVIPMASPMDLRILGKLKSKNVNVIQILHDSKRHPGDYWPNKFAIKKMVKRSHSLIFLSESVKENIGLNMKNMPESCTVGHPYFERSGDEPGLSIDFKYILLIGRIRKYKGAKSLVSSWKKSYTPGQVQPLKLVIAGKGAQLVSSKNKYGIIRLNYWLNDADFDFLISESQAVLFPYLESSQSGVMAKSMYANKFISISNIPGLIEQSKDYEKKYVGDVRNLQDWLQTTIKSMENRNLKSENGSNLITKDIVGKSWTQLTSAITKLSV